MRRIVLVACVSLALMVFLLMLIGIARHRAQARADGARMPAWTSEYLWGLIPLLMIAGAAFPVIKAALSEAPDRRAPVSAEMSQRR